MADPQHPDIDEAARLIAAAVYSPQPDMSGDIWRSITPERRRRAEDAAREVVRTLARPEDEEVRRLRRDIKEAATLMVAAEVRAVAEKALAVAHFERERDAVLRATRAEQEAARLRAALTRTLEHISPTLPEARRMVERALAAAAGTEPAR